METVLIALVPSLLTVDERLGSPFDDEVRFHRVAATGNKYAWSNAALRAEIGRVSTGWSYCGSLHEVGLSAGFHCYRVPEHSDKPWDSDDNWIGFVALLPHTPYRRSTAATDAANV